MSTLNRDSIASKDRATDELRIGKGFDESGRDLIEVLSQNLARRNVKDHKRNLNEDSHCPSRHSNRAPP